MKKILYVHGYNGNPRGESFRRLEKFASEDYEMHSIDYDSSKPSEAVRDIMDYVYDNDIDLIIGSSLGGFLTMLCYGIPRVVINPCMRPTLELPKLGYEGPMDDYESFEDDVMHILADKLEKPLCIGCFGTDDELFGDRYRKPFEKKGYKSVDIEGGHHVSVEGAKKIMEDIVPKMFEELSKISEAIEGMDNNPLFE